MGTLPISFEQESPPSFKLFINAEYMGTLPLSFEQESPPSFKLFIKAETMAPFPEIKSKHSLVAKHVTEGKWNKLNEIVSKTSQFTLAKAIACAVEFDNQHCGIYAGDEDSYVDFAEVFDPLICEYHGLAPDSSTPPDMDSSKNTGNVEADVPVHSCRIRLAAASKDSVFPPVSPSNNVSMLRL